MARNSHGMMAATSRATPGLATDNWVGGAGGNGDWNTAADWSGGVPSDAATAVFATGDFGYTVTGDATIGAIMVNGDGVTFDGTLTQDASGPATFLTGINGADVTLDANSFVTGGAINFQDGSLLEVQGTLITTGGTADVVLVDGLNADAIASSAITLNQLYVQNGASFTGDVMLNDGGNITLDASSSFGGDTVTLLGSGTIYDAAAPGGAGGGGSVADNIVFATAGGTLNLAADPGVTLLVTGDISGAGSLVVSGGTVELAGDNTFTGGIDVQYGTLQLDTATALPSNLVILSGGALVTEVLASGMLTDSVVAATGTADTVTATGGALLVFGAAAASLTFTGGADHSTVVGGLAALTVQGGSAGDAIFGGSATLNFTGGAGLSTVIGGAGQVIANGGATGSVIFGGTSGLDQLSTGTGNSTLVGGAASTTFFGSGAGSSLIVVTGGGLVNLGAATGNDTVFGGNFANTIEGGIGGTETDVLQAGNTTLYGNTGISEVFGGSGSLMLDLVNGFGGGTTKIAGISLDQLHISLVEYAPGTAAAALASETVSGGNTYLALGDGTHVDLFGITGLSMSNFT